MEQSPWNEIRTEATGDRLISLLINPSCLLLCVSRERTKTILHNDVIVPLSTIYIFNLDAFWMLLP